MADIVTPERAALVARVAELGPTFARRAHAVDTDAAFPTIHNSRIFALNQSLKKHRIFCVTLGVRSVSNLDPFIA